MGDMGDLFNDMKRYKRDKRRQNLQAADPTGWHKFTDYHWRRKLLGWDLDYWPSTKRWCYRGKYSNGDVNAFIASKNGGGAKQEAKLAQRDHLEAARNYRHPKE